MHVLTLRHTIYKRLSEALLFAKRMHIWTDKDALKDARLAGCMLNYSLLFLFHTPTLVRWHIGHLYLLKNAYTDIRPMHEYSDGDHFK